MNAAADHPANIVQPDDAARMGAICDRIPGYSNIRQYAFFLQVLTQTEVKDILVLGVYHGRDIAFMLDILGRLKREDVRIVGVDKFTNDACADWPKEAALQTWRGAGFGEPPNYLAALENTRSPFVEILCLTDETFLASTERKFDAVYLDTAHDYETVARQIRQLPRICRKGAIICGDDYSNEGTWGVKRAVTEAFEKHDVFADMVWASDLDRLRATPVK